MPWVSRSAQRGAGQWRVDLEISAQFNSDSVNGIMFKRIFVANDASPESGCALASAVRLYSALGLRIVCSNEMRVFDRFF